MSKLSQELKDKIVESLKPINAQKIILFGSYAYGEPNEDSDFYKHEINSVYYDMDKKGIVLWQQNS